MKKRLFVHKNNELPLPHVEEANEMPGLQGVDVSCKADHADGRERNLRDTSYKSAQEDKHASCFSMNSAIILYSRGSRGQGLLRIMVLPPLLTTTVVVI